MTHSTYAQYKGGMSEFIHHKFQLKVVTRIEPTADYKHIVNYFMYESKPTETLLLSIMPQQFGVEYRVPC